MTDSYTVFWSVDRWVTALSVGHRPLPVLFGGPQPGELGFRRAGVKVGDVIYPIAVANHRVHVVARMRVREMILLGQEDGPTLVNERFAQFKPWRFLAPLCTDEVVLGMDATVPRADLELATELLRRLSFRSQRGERPFRQVRDGQVTSTAGLQGICRLSAASAEDLSALIESAPAGLSRSPRPAAGVWAGPAQSDVLF